MNLSLSTLSVWALFFTSSCEGRIPCTEASSNVFVCTTIPNDLMNSSVLVNGYSVTCNDPPHLKGIPVWNASDFACSVTMSTAWPDQHTQPQLLLPVLLGLLGLLVLLLLLVFLLLKRKQGKEQVKPDGQGTKQQEKHPQHKSAKEHFSKDHQSTPNMGAETIHPELCAAMFKKQPVTVSGVQRCVETAQLAKGDQEIPNNTNALIVPSLSEDWVCFPSDRFAQSNQEMEKHNSIPTRGSSDPSLAVFMDQSVIDLHSKSVSNSTALDKVSCQNLGRTDGAKQERNGNGKPVGMILPLYKMSTGNDTICHLNSDEDLSSVVNGRHNVSRCPRGAGRLIHDEADSVHDSSAGLSNSLTESQPNEESGATSKAGSQGNTGHSKGRVMVERGAESRVKTVAIGLKSKKHFGEKNQSSMIGEDMSTTKGMRRGQLGCETEIFPGTQCDAMIPTTPNSEQTVGTNSPTKEKPLRSSEYGYVNLLHEIVENQGRRTRERWKQTTRYKIMHK
ncbi:hypothetical protein chiPu_0016194 [Chiloscyllium punctatum]|uniref:Uncharacterized protein n=1 Tax=Chiloscyllium punctatum TaxID=137246 RepID=A0A401T4Y1_CHIPU|nr:hypothetical protein [Chiloscyllium punctatum]